jgi:ribosomal protein S18 acetylase RimI-like enzyme
MKVNVKIRPAKPPDIEALARLWMVTFPDKFGPILGHKAERIICDWLRLSERHLQTTILAEVGGVVAGYIILNTPSAPRADTGRWLWRALQLHNGILGAMRSFILMILVNNNYRPAANEVYIEMLGVAPAWRGSGVGGKLIAHAEAIARTENANKITLNVVCDNKPALKLYEKVGFEATQQKQSRILQWITGHSGYYLMVKRLAPLNSDEA